MLNVISKNLLLVSRKIKAVQLYSVFLVLCALIDYKLQKLLAAEKKVIQILKLSILNFHVLPLDYLYDSDYSYLISNRRF